MPGPDLEYPLGYGIGQDDDSGVPRSRSSGRPVFTSKSLNPAVFDLGQDISTINGLDPTFTLLTQVQACAERMVRLITTPRGSLVFFPNRCMDVRDYLKKRITPSDIARFKSEVEGELIKDEEVSTASCLVSYDSTSRTLSFVLNVVAAFGPFQFVLAVSQVSVQLLQLQAI